MDTKKIKHLEFIRAKLQVDKKHAIYCKNYAKARNCHIRLKNINNSINQEQDKLWNYVLNESISVTNFQLFENIFRYFDQKNYQSRMIDKIENQNENLYLMNLLNKRYAVNEEEIVGIVFR